MTLAVYQFFDPHTIQTSSSVAALSFYRSDLTNTVTLTQSASNTLTCSGSIVATGINFGGNTLSTYTEGTWTPVIQGSTGSAGSYAASVALGIYRKIGKLVMLSWQVSLTNKGSWTGELGITGLPFTSSSSVACPQAGHLCDFDNITFSGQAVVEIIAGNSNLIFASIVSGSNVSEIAYSAITNTSIIAGSIIYTTDA